jgi:hypothetical protein
MAGSGRSSCGNSERWRVENRKATNPPPDGHTVVVGILYLHIAETGVH